MSLIPDSEPTWFWDKYRDLPTLQLPSYTFPLHDGDTALLDQLIDDIIDAHPVILTPLPADRIYHETKAATGFDPQWAWPVFTLADLRRFWHGR